jgi:hypothetical protein
MGSRSAPGSLLLPGAMLRSAGFGGAHHNYQENCRKKEEGFQPSAQAQIPSVFPAGAPYAAGFRRFGQS